MQKKEQRGVMPARNLAYCPRFVASTVAPAPLPLLLRGQSRRGDIVLASSRIYSKTSTETRLWSLPSPQRCETVRASVRVRAPLD